MEETTEPVQPEESEAYDGSVDEKLEPDYDAEETNKKEEA